MPAGMVSLLHGCVLIVLLAELNCCLETNYIYAIWCYYVPYGTSTAC